MSVDLLLSMQEDNLTKLSFKVESIDDELKRLISKYEKLLKEHKDLQDRYETIVEQLAKLLEASEDEEPIAEKVDTTLPAPKRYDWGECCEE